MFIQPTDSFNLSSDNVSRVLRSLISRLISSKGTIALEQYDATSYHGLKFVDVRSMIGKLESIYHKPTKHDREVFDASVKAVFDDEVKFVTASVGGEAMASLSFEQFREQGSSDLTLVSLVFAELATRSSDSVVAGLASKVSTYFERTDAFGGLVGIKLSYTSSISRLKHDAFGMDDPARSSVADTASTAGNLEDIYRDYLKSLLRTVVLVLDKSGHLTGNKDRALELLEAMIIK